MELKAVAVLATLLIVWMAKLLVQKLYTVNCADLRASYPVVLVQPAGAPHTLLRVKVVQ